MVNLCQEEGFDLGTLGHYAASYLLEVRLSTVVEKLTWRPKQAAVGGSTHLVTCTKPCYRLEA